MRLLSAGGGYDTILGMDEMARIESARGWRTMEIDVQEAWRDMTPDRQIRPRFLSSVTLNSTQPAGTRDVRIKFSDIKHPTHSNFVGLRDLCASLGHLDIADGTISIPEQWCFTESDIKTLFAFQSNIIHKKQRGEISKRAALPFRASPDDRNIAFVRSRDGQVSVWTIWLARKGAEEWRRFYNAKPGTFDSPNALLEWMIRKSEPREDQRVQADRLVLPDMN
jgi:hypothetical protein